MNKLLIVVLAALAGAPGLAQAQLTPPAPVTARAPGLYVQVIEGLIHVTNPVGTSSLSAGLFGYTPSYTQPPVILPKNPGLLFTPPPAFSSGTAPASSTSTASKASTVDCEVR